MKIKKILFILIACLYGGLLSAQVPANDACDDATIAMSLPFIDTLDATNATNNDGSIEVEGCGNGMNDGVWYAFTGTGRNVTIVLTTADFDSEIGVYTGDCGALECVGNFDASFVDEGETGVVSTILGVNYLVNIGNWDTSDGVEGNIIVEISSDSSNVSLCGVAIPSNNLENGSFIGEGGQQVAADFIVSVNTPNLNVTGLSANLLAMQEIESVDILFYEDNGGLPGNQFGATISDLVPSSQTLVGDNFGFNFYDVILTLPTAMDFPGNAVSDTRYWIQIVGKSADPEAVLGWETTTANVVGAPLAFIPSGSETNQWNPSTDDCVFTLMGECTFVEGCFAASDFTLAQNGFTDAFFTWSSAIVPEGGYVFSLFDAGADPAIDAPIFTENIGADKNFVQVDNLVAGTQYDAYLVSSCGTTTSTAIKLSFTSRNAPDNDNLCNAIAIQVGSNCADAPYSNSDATTEIDEPSGTCFDGGAQKTVWFSFIAPDNGSVIISTDILPATLTDSEIALYAAPTDCADLSTLGDVLACSQDNGVNIEFNSIIEIATLIAGDTYYVQVSGYLDSEGAFCLQVLQGADCPAVEGLTSTTITQTEVQLTWDEEAASKNGYVISIFEAGADPMTATAIAIETVAAGELVSVFTDLSPGTSYDVYVVVDCDDKGFSESSESYTFSTAPAAPLCEESFFDSGGADNAYQSNEDYSLVIEPIDATSIITLTFTSVSIETGFDFLRVYDGEDASATELSPEEDGILEPSTFTSSVAGGKLFVSFNSDSGVNGAGWEGSVSCTFSGLNELDASEFSIYPNPTTNNLVITGIQEIEKVEILNLLGQRLMQEFPRSNTTILNIADLNVGTYMVRTHIDGKIGTKKVIKL